MPSVSAKQHRYMAMMAFNPPKGKGGPSRKVAKEFVAADKGKKFKRKKR
jgi:hypothetical protein